MNNKQLTTTNVQDCNSMQPLVSVLMPVRNGMPYLPKAINSLVRQSLNNWELLIIENASTDTTQQYLATLNDSRIQIYSLPNPGLVNALNFGLERAKSRWIARLDSDDIATENRLELQLAFANANPNVVLFSSNYELIDENDNFIREIILPASDDAIRWRLLWQNSFVHPGVMYQRDLATQIGGYKLNVEWAEDYDLWCRLSKCGPVANIPLCLLKYRTHGANGGLTNQNDQLSRAKRVSATNIHEMCPAISQDLCEELRSFVLDGTTPVRFSLFQLAAAYNQLIKAVRIRFPNPTSELNNLINITSKEIKYRCRQSAKLNRWRPIAFLFWVMLGELFTNR